MKQHMVEIALERMYQVLDELIEECSVLTPERKLVKTREPSLKAIMKARGFLPARYSNSLEVRK